MAEEKKKKKLAKKKRANKYKEKLSIEGSLEDVLKVAVKDKNKKKNNL